MRSLAKSRNLLQELVRQLRAELAIAVSHRREILHFVDEDDYRAELEDVLEALSEELALAFGGLADELARRL